MSEKHVAAVLRGYIDQHKAQQSAVFCGCTTVGSCGSLFDGLGSTY